MNRRDFLKALGFGGALAAAPRWLLGDTFLIGPPPPNVILCMTDDQGWGDTGYNGHPRLKTPTLDEMSRTGLRFDRFYSGAPVCSPTRGSCLTGRHPYRYGIYFANVGHMPKEEVTLAEVLKARGYTTGHFGKWHLGTLTKTVADANRGGPKGAAHYSPPWDNGFDVCFSTESKVPTCDPMKKPGTDQPYGTHYWTGPEQMVTEGLDGDDSRIIMDRVVPFLRRAVKAGTNFFAVVWFHAPHLPVVAGPEHRKPYADLPEEAQHYLGCITAMDQQIGRLRKELRDLGVARDTMLWFCSDNGPEGPRQTPTNGSAGGLRGRKRSLFEGGIRVPGLLEWPAKVSGPRVVKTPCSTEDYFPTVLAALGIERKKGEIVDPLDGVNLMPLIDGEMTERPRPLGRESSGQLVLIDNRYKLIRASGGGQRKKGKGKGDADTAKQQPSWMLFDLLEDPAEKTDLAAAKPDIVAAMSKTLLQWQSSCKRSLKGTDYP